MIDRVKKIVSCTITHLTVCCFCFLLDIMMNVNETNNNRMGAHIIRYDPELMLDGVFV